MKSTIKVMVLSPFGRLLEEYVSSDWPLFSECNSLQFKRAADGASVTIHGGGVTIVEEHNEGAPKPKPVKKPKQVRVVGHDGNLIAVYRAIDWPRFCNANMFQFRRTDNGLWVQIHGGGISFIEEVDQETPLRAERQGIVSLF